MTEESNNKCPVFCRKCGAELALEKRWIAKVLFHPYTPGVELEYHKILTCPIRFKFFGWLHWTHDRRELSDDCLIEYFGTSN